MGQILPRASRRSQPCWRLHFRLLASSAGRGWISLPVRGHWLWQPGEGKAPSLTHCFPPSAVRVRDGFWPCQAHRPHTGAGEGHALSLIARWPQWRDCQGHTSSLLLSPPLAHWPHGRKRSLCDERGRVEPSQHSPLLSLEAACPQGGCPLLCPEPGRQGRGAYPTGSGEQALWSSLEAAEITSVTRRAEASVPTISLACLWSDIVS